MICGNVAEIMVEILDLTTDTLVEFFGAKRDVEINRIAEAVTEAFLGFSWPIKEAQERSGKLAHVKLADSVFEGLVRSGIVKTQARKDELKAVLRKKFFLYSSKFKTKKLLKEQQQWAASEQNR